MKKTLLLLLLLFVLLPPISRVGLNPAKVKASNGTPIHNLNTGINYTSIQQAINDNATENGHTIFAEAGTYYENLIVNKTLSLIGEDSSTTAIDGNHTGGVVEINADAVNITGFTIRNSGNNQYGIYVANSHNTSIRNNAITNNDIGILLHSSLYSNITLNNITNNEFGLELSTTNNSNIQGNHMANNDYAIQFSISSDNNLRENVMNDNKYNFFFPPTQTLAGFLNTIDASNLVDGAPVYYFVYETDLVVKPSTHPQVGFLALINCSNITVERTTLNNNGHGLLLAHTTNSTIVNNIVFHNYNGISLYSSSNITLSGNNVTENDDDGLEVNHSHHNNITGNNVDNNGGIGGNWIKSESNVFLGNNVTNNGIGVYLSNSTNNTFLENNVTTNNFYGFDLFGSSNNTFFGNNVAANNFHGINLFESSNNTFYGNNITTNGQDGLVFYESASYNHIFGNNVTHNKKGIYIDYSSNNNSIEGNNIANNDVGIDHWNSTLNTLFGNDIRDNEVGFKLSESINNSFFYNNFVNNTEQVDVTTPGTVNFWSDGVEGNYWSNYGGADSNQDGIGDSTHIIDADNQDHNPLMGMYKSFKTTQGKHVNTISNSTVKGFEYFESNKTIRLHMFNSTVNQTHGFIRIRIPHVLISEPYNVTVEGLNPIFWNYTLHDDAENRWLYFNYEHAKATVEITIVPEFPVFFLSALLMTVTFLTAYLYKTRMCTSTNQ